MGLLLLLVPLMALLFHLVGKSKPLLHTISVCAATLLLLLSLFLTRIVLHAGKIEYALLGNFFYIDPLSIIILDIVLLIGFIASIYAINYLKEEVEHTRIDPSRIRLYYILMDLFMFAMILTLVSNNMGIMWVGLEATTIASVFLVGFYNDKPGLEAAWKYVIICSVGIALALLGTILLHLAAVAGTHPADSLNWTILFATAGFMNSPLLKFAFIFILVGFGTKAGLTPLNTWLPDAHSQAPAPVSALLSGGLLNCAMYGIIRAAAIVNKNLGNTHYTGNLLVVMGLLSVVYAAVFMLTQKDYKRMLAYSSIEHMGLISFAIGMFTPVSVFAALLHMINHSLTKSLLFFSSGNIYLKYKSKEIADVTGLLRVLPLTGTIFFAGLLAIAGMPPFSVFASEFSIISAAFLSRKPFLGIMIILLISLVFMGIALTMFKMFFGPRPDCQIECGEKNNTGNIPLLLLLMVIALTGLYLPHDVINLIAQAQKIVVGG